MNHLGVSTAKGRPSVKVHSRSFLVGCPSFKEKTLIQMIYCIWPKAQGGLT